MQPEPTENRTNPATDSANTSPQPVRVTSDLNIADTLIETNVGVLVMLGGAIKRFGLKPVVGFVAGAACLYGYALYRPLPYVKGNSEAAIQSSMAAPAPAQAPAEVKTVQLHGVIRDADNKPVKGLFEVGVLANQYGPTRSTDGSFVLKAPQSDTYNLAFWTTEDGIVRVSRGNIAEKDGNSYTLQTPLVFPPDITASVRSTSRSSQSRSQISRSDSGDH